MVIRGHGAFRPEVPAEMRRLDRLNGRLPYDVFESVEHYSGLSDPQLAALLDVRPRRLAEAVAQLNRGEDEAKVAAALARFIEEGRGDDEAADRAKLGDLLRGANSVSSWSGYPCTGEPKGNSHQMWPWYHV